MTKRLTNPLDKPGTQKQRKHQGTTLNVHIVPYSNENISPLKNVDSQFAGQENRDGDPMTRAMIIFPEVVDRLTQDPSKTFATDAVKFAQMWYTRAPKSMQLWMYDIVKRSKFKSCNFGFTIFLKGQSSKNPATSTL